MNSLSNDIIYKDEIIINITDIDVPDFEFYDLPGIRTYPQTVADLSVNICKKYLSDKKSIVLCVVPCTTTRLTSCQSIALVKEAKMDHKTIIIVWKKAIKKKNNGLTKIFMSVFLENK